MSTARSECRYHLGNVARSSQACSQPRLGAAARPTALRWRLSAPRVPRRAPCPDAGRGAPGGAGGVLKTRPDYNPAGPSHERALAIREKATGAEHPDVADSLYDVGL